MSDVTSGSSTMAELPDEGYARRWLYVSLLSSDAVLVRFVAELGEWYLSQLLGSWESVEPDVSASWDASADAAPSWAELDALAKGAYVGRYAAECAVAAMRHLLDWDVTSLCPDADESWRSFQTD